MLKSYSFKNEIMIYVDQLQSGFLFKEHININPDIYFPSHRWKNVKGSKNKGSNNLFQHQVTLRFLMPHAFGSQLPSLHHIFPTFPNLLSLHGTSFIYHLLFFSQLFLREYA